jgi:hypothetical protein
MSEDKSASNIKKIVFTNDSEKAIGKGKIGRRLERFDPDAIDGDNDGIVQEGTRFSRPAGPQNMPKVKPIQVPRREDVPLPNRQPSKPTTTPAPSRPATPAKPTVPAGRLSGNIGREDSNTFDRDDDDTLASELFSPEELEELVQSQDDALDELAQSMADGYDVEAELKDMIENYSELPDPNEIIARIIEAGPENADEDEIAKWMDERGMPTMPQEYLDAGWEYDSRNRRFISPKMAQKEAKMMQDWLKDHPFNRESRGFEEREWADNEYDGQAERYAPTPTEIKQGLDINWDNMAKIAGFTSEQKEDWELSEEDLNKRNAAAEERLGDSAGAMAERAKVWQRVQNGEGFREIAPDYPDVHYSTVREMSRMGAAESGVSKQKSQAAERAAREQARQRANQAGIEQLLEKMKSATSSRDLRGRLRDEIAQMKELRKRTSNEYQMIRKSQVEKWRLGSMLHDTMPVKTDDETDIQFYQRMSDWFDESADFFTKLAEDINFNHDITTATDRAYNFYTDQVNIMEGKLNDIDSFFDEVTAFKNKPSGGGLSGNISSGRIPRGVRISKPAQAKTVDSREFNSIKSDLEKISKGSFSDAAKAKRPSGFSSRESSIYSVVKGAKDFSKKSKRNKAKKA